MKFRVKEQRLLNSNMADYMYGFGLFIMEHRDGNFTFNEVLDYFESNQVTGINQKMIDMLFGFMKQEDDLYGNLIQLLHAVRAKAFAYCKDSNELSGIKEQLESYMRLYLSNDAYMHFEKEITSVMGK